MNRSLVLTFSISFLFLLSSSGLAIEVVQENDLQTLLDSLLSGGGAGNTFFNGPTGSIGTYQNASGLWGIQPARLRSTTMTQRLCPLRRLTRQPKKEARRRRMSR